MATSLPIPSITKKDTGWLLRCTNIVGCDHESWHPRRPGADRAWADHVKKHAPKDGNR